MCINLKFNNEEKAREKGRDIWSCGKMFKYGRCFGCCRLLVGETKGESLKTQRRKRKMDRRYVRREGKKRIKNHKRRVWSGTAKGMPLPQRPKARRLGEDRFKETTEGCIRSRSPPQTAFRTWEHLKQGHREKSKHFVENMVNLLGYIQWQVPYHWCQHDSKQVRLNNFQHEKSLVF